MPILVPERYDRVFISFGGPDEDFARRLYEVLKPTVPVYFFPETASWGQRIDTEVYRRLQEHDRILLLCSKDSLNRTGVLQEIRETLDRETRDDAVYLLPIRLDDYLFADDGWITEQPDLTQRLRRRVVGDFPQARIDQSAFDRVVRRLLQELSKDYPANTSHSAESGHS